MNSFRPGRRRFVQGLGMMGMGAGFAVPALAASENRDGGFAVLRGPDIALTLEEMAVNFTGRPRIATVVNRVLPGPLLCRARTRTVGGRRGRCTSPTAATGSFSGRSPPST